MRDFSIDIQAEKIHSPKTKEYFQEVIKSYYSESYRSAIVMLYSIAIADIMFKIQELQDLYSDISATEIMKEITDSQSKNPNSPDWESKLISLVSQKTNLLEPADLLHLKTLQSHRHLCAHPVLTLHFELYTPNKETARSHIRNILEGLLTKPAFLSRKIFVDFLIELSGVKNIIRDYNQLEKHLKTKYLDRFSDKIAKSVFRSLWKVTFKTDSKEANANRDINLNALLILTGHGYSYLLESIKNEPDYYSTIDTNYLHGLIRLLNAYPAIFSVLNDSLQILLKNIVSKNADLDALAVFLSNNVLEHMHKISSIPWRNDYEDEYISTESILRVFEYGLIKGHRDVAYDFLIVMFSLSNHYDTADVRMDNLILPYLRDFNQNELIKIVESINNNSQIYDRRKASGTNHEIRSRINELYGATIDLSKYTNF